MRQIGKDVGWGRGALSKSQVPKTILKRGGAFPPRLKGRRRRLEGGKERGARLSAPRDSH